MAQLGGFSGRVYDKLTHRTIEGVLVAIAQDLSIKTDEKGIFSVAGIKPGKYRITAFEDGYVVHSCKGIAIAGEMTTLESFHLVPDCLAAQYPENMGREEEETVEEEVVEFAMEPPQETPSEKMPEKTIQASPDAVTMRDITGETVPGLSILKTTAEEETVKHPETVVDEKEVEPPSITEFPLNHVDATIADAAQLKGVSEKVQEVAPEVAPQELTVEEILIETPIEDRAQGEHPETVHQEQLFEPATEEISKQYVRSQEHQGQSLETGPFVGTVSEIIPQEEPPIEAFLEEMQTPVIESDSTETVLSVPEEIIIEELFSTPETIIAETMQPEEIPEKIQEEILETALQEPLVGQSRLKQLWGILRGKAPKEIDQDQRSEPSAEKTIDQALPLPEHQEQPSESSMKIVPQAIPHEDAIEGTCLEEQPIEVSLEKMQTPLIESDSTETVISIPEEVIITETSSVEEMPLNCFEITIAEAAQSEEAPWTVSIEKTSIETIKEDMTLEGIKEVVYQKQYLSPVTEESIEQVVPSPVYLTILLEPFVDIPPEIVLQRILPEEIYEEEQPVETSLEEMQTPVIDLDSTEAAMPLPEETIIGEGPSVEELAAEPMYNEQCIGPSTEVIPQTVLRAEVSEKTHEEEQPGDISTEEALGCGAVDEDSVAPEEAPENLADFDIASLSDEERAAMSNEENMAEAVGFKGSINAQPNPAFRGLPITIAYHLRNVTCDDPNNFIIRIILANPDTGTIHETFEAPATCTKDTFSIGGFTFSTASYEACVYALSMQIVSKKTKSANVLVSIPLEIKNLF